MMDKELLSLLKDARLNRKSEYRKLNYEELYQLSYQHQVSALIYNQIYDFSDFPLEIKDHWKKEAMKINAFQTMKTIKLLDIYKQFINHHIEVMIVKGMICRSLYPQPENRQSYDEDLYIQVKDLKTMTSLLIKDNFQILHESDDVITFLDLSSGLTLEVHTSLFSEKSNAYGQFQELFKDAFWHTTKHHIENLEILSLDHNYHLLFLILHFVKHFLHSGVGIRQVLDMIMYIEKYNQYIEWNCIIKILVHYQIYDLMMNVFLLAHDYLDFDCSHIPMQNIKQNDYQDLLIDIMSAGIFGQSSKERIHSSTITLNTISDGKTNIFKSVFPSFIEMKGKYEYLHSYPFLLPIAYLSRIYHYLLKNKSNQSQRTIKIGKQRIKLLKKYKVIK